MAKFCVNCGKELGENSKFCGECGTPVAVNEEIKEEQIVEEVEATEETVQEEPIAEAVPAEEIKEEPIEQEPAIEEPAVIPMPEAEENQTPVTPIPSHSPNVTPAAPSNNYVSTWAYFGLMFVFAIPLVGLITSIIMSFAPKNRSLKNFARANLIWTIICFVLSLISIILMFLLGYEIIEDMTYEIQYMLDDIRW